MRIGVLGAGRIGQTHITNLAELPRVTEVLVYEPDPQAVLRVQEIATVCSSVEELLERSEGVINISAEQLTPLPVAAHHPSRDFR